MLKKALIATAVLAASGVAFANGGSFAPAPAPTHTGAFYVGAAVSRDTAQFDVDSANVLNAGLTAPLVANASNVYTSSSDLSGNGIDGQLFAGYGMTFEDHYTLAAEVFGSISSLKGDYDVANTFSAPVLVALGLPGSYTFNSSASLKLQHTLGVALMPGVMISPSTNLYLRVGYVYSRFKLSDTGAGLTGLIPPFGTGVFNGVPASEGKNESGLQLGLGASTMVTNNVGLRLEYTWERYGNFNVNQVVGPVTGATAVAGIPVAASATVGSSIKVKPQSVDTVNFGVFYAFNS